MYMNNVLIKATDIPFLSQMQCICLQTSLVSSETQGILLLDEVSSLICNASQVCISDLFVLHNTGATMIITPDAEERQCSCTGTFATQICTLLEAC